MVLALDDPSIEFNGILDCIGQAVDEHGWAGVYRGFSLAFTGASLLKNLFVSLTKVLIEEKMMCASSAPMWALIVGNVAAFIAYPLDTARRRMITDCGGVTYKNDFECLLTIARTEGATALWAGSFTNIARNVAFSIFRNVALSLARLVWAKMEVATPHNSNPGSGASSSSSSSFPPSQEVGGEEVEKLVSEFILAAQIGDLDTVRSFVRRDDYDQICRSVGVTPATARYPLDALHAAVIGQQHEVVALLLADGADVHSRTLTGERHSGTSTACTNTACTNTAYTNASTATLLALPIY
jgi:hypothetical protein